MFNNKNYRQYLPIILSIVSLVLLTLVGFFSSEKWLSKQAEKVQPKVVLAETLDETASSKEKKTESSSSSEEKKVEETAAETSPEASVAEATSETTEVVTETAASYTEVPVEVAATETATQYVEVATVDNIVNYTETANYTYDTTSYATSNVTSSTTTLANGNTAGEIGSYAAAQMAAATGVAQETWEYIIARESNGDPSAANASGASGLFQTIPGWGSTATVEDQIQSALNAYNSQGLAAWGY